MPDDEAHTNEDSAKENAREGDGFIIEKEDEQPKDTIKRLREKLKETTQKKQEYLDGWQRAKADLANAKKNFTDEKANAKERAVVNLVEDILPVLDSFQMAKADKASWEAVDKQWRDGLIQIANQLEQALKKHGVVEIAPEAGDQFDPKLHNSVDTVVDEDEPDNTVAQLEARGFQLDDRIIRSADVVVYTHD